MGFVFSCLGSCFGSCLASCACATCCSCCKGNNKNRKSRIPYLIIVFLTVIAAVILRYADYSKAELYNFSFEICESKACFGNQAVYRLSFALFVFFILHVVGVLINNKFHDTFFIGKLGIYGAMCVGVFFISSDFVWYVEAARVISAIFLLLQIYVLIDWAYSWNENWIEKEWYAAVISTTLTVFVGCILMWVFMFIWFAADGCGLQKFFIISTIIVTVVISILSGTNIIEHGSILTSSIVTGYCTFLLFSALTSDPSSCNSMGAHDGAKIPVLVLGIILAAASIVYSGYRLSTSSGALFGDEGAEESLMSDGLHDDADPEDPEKPAKDSKKDEEEERELTPEELANEQKSNVFFHVAMTLTAVYMAMLLTNWSAETHSSANNATTMSKESMWVKIASLWATGLLYAWTLCAPYIYPDRDFS